MRKLECLTLLNFIIKKDYKGIKELLKSGSVNFDDFGKFAWDSHLAGNLYSVLSNSKLKYLFPDTLIEKLKPAYLMQWTKNEKLIKDTEDLSGLFHKAGKEVIFLKGLFLAERFYGNIDSRAISDIDILTKRDEIDEIEHLLVKSGFLRKSLIFLSKSLSVHFAHHFEYVRGDTDLELHWALSTHSSFKLDYAKIRREKKSFEFRGRNYWVLSDEYELVFQTLSIFKDIELGTIKLKSFVDVYMIMKAAGRDMKWKEFFDARKREGIYVISLNILDLVFSLLDCRDEFREVSSHLRQNKTRLKYKTLGEKLELLEGSRFAVKNKSWTFGLYEMHPLNALCWWAVSLPFRLTTYRKSSAKLLKMFY